MTTRERNERLFLERFPEGGAALFESFPVERDFEIVRTPSGNPSARSRGVYLHSRHDPVREAERLVTEELARGGPRPAVFYGFGLGYLVEAYLSRTRNLPVFVVEPDPALFRAALGVRDLSAVIGSNRISFFLASDPETIASVIESSDSGEFTAFRLRSVYEKDRVWYERVDGALTARLRRREVNQNTLKRFGRLWVRNLVRNLPLLGTVSGIARIAGAFQGIPALVLAAGPSLDGILPLLPALARRCVVVAVDTSLRACLRAGVDPDFTVVVDPQYWNTRHLDWAGETGSVLVSESSTHPRIFRKRFGGLYFAGSLFPLGTYIESRAGRKGELGAGGSVSTSAWDFARVLGCRPVFIAGLDLGFPELKTHTAGSFFEQRVHTASARLTPAEHAAYLALREAGTFTVPANGGGRVLTDNRLAVYKAWFESQMKLHPECVTYNLSEGGTAIAGMPYKPAEELLAFPELREPIDRTMEEVRRIGGPAAGNPAAGNTGTAAASGTSGSVRDAVRELAAELRTLDTLAIEAISVCGSLERNFRAGRPLEKDLSRLSAIDEKILRFPAKDVAGFLLNSVRDLSPRASGRSGGIEIIENSRRLYRELHEAIRYHLTLLEHKSGR